MHKPPILFVDFNAIDLDRNISLMAPFTTYQRKRFHVHNGDQVMLSDGNAFVLGTVQRRSFGELIAAPDWPDGEQH